LIYVENPIREFGGIELPQWRVELDMFALSQEPWVWMLRMMLLFMVLCRFFVSLVLVFR